MTRRSPLVDTGVIYCGDCLDQLKSLPPACVDLIYIDPPFNSNRNYEVFWGETKEKRAFEDRHASTQAYIEFMRPRCVELARVLKKTGSFYYHCDDHASHYVKVMLDQILGENAFINEIVWQRTGTHNDAKRWPALYDSLMFYSRGKYTWNPRFTPQSVEDVAKRYRHKEKDGRRFRLGPMDAPEGGGMAAIIPSTGKPRGWYEWKGYQPPARGWRYSPETMAELDRQGRIHYPKDKTKRLARKLYLDESKGALLGNIWTDIPPLQASSIERLGYPTQKPLALLDRIVQASSNKGDVVLDAFCGCGTALISAQNLKRQWIGIDVSPTACRVMAKRLRDVCHLREDEALWKAGRGFVVRDLPWSEDQLRKIPPFEFENWAVIALGGIPNKAQVGDMGIDGRIYPVSAVAAMTDRVRERAPAFDFMDFWYPIQVKQKGKVGRPDIDSFEAVMTREDRTKGFFVSFDYSSNALREIDAFFRKSGKVIIPLTVREILDEHLAAKLA